MSEYLWSDFMIVIQARMGSTRLPGKTLLPLGSSTILGLLINRLKESGVPCESIAVATSNLIGDQAIVTYTKGLNISCYTGSESNVLQRYVEAAKLFESKHIVRITADNPFINIELLKSVIKKHLSSGGDFTSTRLIDGEKVVRYLPKGSSVDVFSKSSLQNINLDSCSDFDKEHVIPIFYRVGPTCLYKRQDALADGVDIEENSIVSIDTKEDYIRAKQLFEIGEVND